MIPAARRPLGAVVVTAALAALLTVPAPPGAAEPHARPDAVRWRSFAGVVVSPTGRPVAGASVEITTSRSTAQGLICLLAGLTTVLAPLAWWTLDCQPTAARTTTGRDGRYVLSVRADQLLAADDLHHVSVRGARGGRFTGDVLVNRRTRALPPVTLWSVPAAITRSDGRVAFSVSTPRGAGRGFLFLRSSDGRGAAWGLAAGPGGTPVSVDERVIEHGTRSVDGRLTGTWAGREAQWWSAPLAVAPVGSPRSRGLACSSYDTNGELFELRRCPWTDGRLSTELGLPGLLELEKGRPLCLSSAQCDRPGAVVVDLGALQWLRAVVWRGCVFSCELDMSVDGRTWQPWHGERREGRGDAVITGDATVARYVRVSPSGLPLVFLREVSVWSSDLTQPPPVVRVAGLALPAVPTATVRHVLPDALVMLTRAGAAGAAGAARRQQRRPLPAWPR